MKTEILLICLLYACVKVAEPAALEWNQYSLRSGQVGPSGRKHHAFGFDAYRQFLIVFGGLGANETVLNDTWVLDVAAGLLTLIKIFAEGAAMGVA